MKGLLAVLFLFNSVQIGEDIDTFMWEGEFDFVSKGKQEGRLHFDLTKSNGKLFFSEMAIFEFNLKQFKIVNDSVCFSIDFRSGPTHCKGLLEDNTISGIITNTQNVGSKFSFIKSGKPKTVYRLPKANEELSIRAFSNSDSEIRTRNMLMEVVSNYDLDPFIFTNEIRVIDGIIPHSHPMLSIHTADSTTDQLISTFIHEQMHWYVYHKYDEYQKSVDRISELYPEVVNEKFRRPEGSGSVSGTYSHIIINWLEYNALRQLLGDKRALAQITALSGHHYKWIYRTVIDDYEQIKSVLNGNNLKIRQ